MEGDSRRSIFPFIGAVAFVAACGGGGPDRSQGPDASGVSGAAGNGGGAGGSSAGAASSGGVSGAAGNGTDAAGSGGASAGGGGASGASGTFGAAGAPGVGGAATAASGGAAGNGAAGTMAAGGSTATDPVAPRALHVMPGTMELHFNATTADASAGKSTTATHADDPQSMHVDGTKKALGKLAIVFGGIGGGPGTGGIYGYAVSMGFHGFMVATQTNISGAPDQYKNMDTAEAARQVADGRMEAWDGKDRVSWLDIQPPDSVVNRTEAALKYAVMHDAKGDWGYYLNDDGTVRWTDVVLIGYSFGAQTISMVSKYIRVARVCATSGPEDEGFPKAEWISHTPSATPVDRLYMMVGGDSAYPPATGNVGNKIAVTTAAGWPGPVINVKPGDMGPFIAHQIVLVGSGPGAPGGHSEFCAGNGGGWKAICDHCLGVATPP